MYKRLAYRILGLIGILLIIYFFWEDIQGLNIRGLIQSSDNLLIVALIIMGLFTLKSIFFLIPAPLIFISAGMVLPTHLAVIFCSVAVFIGISLTYFYGYFLGRDFVQRRFSHSSWVSEKLDEGDNVILAIFLLRLAPLALEPVSLVMGASSCKYVEYIGASLIGIMPKMFIYLMIGDTLKSPVTIGKITTFIIFIILWFGGTTYLKRNYVDIEIMKENVKKKGEN